MSSRYEVTHASVGMLLPQIEERPPEGLSRGVISVPAWVVIGLGAVVVLLCAAYTVWRFIPGVRR